MRTIALVLCVLLAPVAAGAQSFDYTDVPFEYVQLTDSWDTLGVTVWYFRGTAFDGKPIVQMLGTAEGVSSRYGWGQPDACKVIELGVRWYLWGIDSLSRAEAFGDVIDELCPVDSFYCDTLYDTVYDTIFVGRIEP